MPRYFFDTRDGSRDLDDEGMELAGDEAARTEAVRYLGSLLTDGPVDLARNSQFRVTVRSAAGEIVTTLVVTDVSPVR